MEISGYEFKGQLFCQNCIIDQLPTGENQEFDGWSLAAGVRMSTEDNLNEIAYAFQITRSEHQPDKFPFALSSAQMPEDSSCAACGAELESDETLTPVRVVFRHDKGNSYQFPVTAVFADGEPREREYRSCWSLESEHSSCTRGWYESNTRPATEEEYAATLAGLQRAGYAVTVVSRVSWVKN